MGGAQPLAVTMNGGVALRHRVRPAARAAPRRARATSTRSPTTSTTRSRRVTRRQARSSGRCRSAWSATPPRCCRSCCAAASRSTSSPTRRPRTTRCRTCRRASASTTGTTTRPRSPTSSPTARASRWPSTSTPWSASWTRGAEVFDYGNSLRGEAKLGGYERAFDFPGFVPAYIRPLFCEGKGPFRWAALSGDPADIAATDRAMLELFPENESLARWIQLAGEKRGLPGTAGPDLLARLRRAAPGRPAVQRDGRQRRAEGAGRHRPRPPRLRLASPRRTARPRRMADGSDAIADWPLLNALVNTASGASWVSIHHGGGVGIGRSIHAGQVIVADGTDAGRAEARAGAHQRPGHGRDPARRRRLRPRRPSRRRARRARSRCGSDGGDALRRPAGRDRRRRARPRSAAATRGTRFDAPELDLREWFVEQRARRGLDVETDRNGNIWAWWGAPGPRRRGHRQPPRLGARRRRVRRPARRGQRAGRGRRSCATRGSGRASRSPWWCSPRRRAAGSASCLGSRLLTGAIDADRARGAARRRRRDVRRGGHDGRARPGPDRAATTSALGRIGRFVELHVEQGRGLIDLGAPVAVGSR